MTDNPFKDLAEDVRSRAGVIAEKFKKKFLPKTAKEDEYYKELKEASADMSRLINDPRYAAMQKFYVETKYKLENQLQNILTGDFKSRELRADNAAIVSAQIQLLTYVFEYPERVIREVRELEND
jgi:hypothetical protein